MKLSKPQRNTLSLLGDGSPRIIPILPNRATLMALERRGFIERGPFSEAELEGFKWRITRAGKEALERDEG